MALFFIFDKPPAGSAQQVASVVNNNESEPPGAPMQRHSTGRLTFAAIYYTFARSAHGRRMSRLVSLYGGRVPPRR